MLILGLHLWDGTFYPAASRASRWSRFAHVFVNGLKFIQNKSLGDVIEIRQTTNGSTEYAALAVDKGGLTAPSCHCGNMQDTQTVVLAIQNTHIPIRGLPVYRERSSNSGTARKLSKALTSFLAFSMVDSHNIVYSSQFRAFFHLCHTPISLFSHSCSEFAIALLDAL